MICLGTPQQSSKDPTMPGSTQPTLLTDHISTSIVGSVPITSEKRHSLLCFLGGNTGSHGNPH